MKLSPQAAFLIMLGVVLAVFAALWHRLPLNDSPAYFAFVDDRAFFGVSNAWNVLTNLPFLYVGYCMFKTYKSEANAYYRYPGFVLALGMVLTAFGSAYFHWNPNSETLFWDRLPMVIAFTGVLLFLVTDRFSPDLTLAAAVPMLLLAIGSVIYWKVADDLRPYAVLQLGLLLFSILIAVFRKPNRITNGAVFGMAFFYLLAKVVEYQDGALYEMSEHFISGHSLKHLFAAGAVIIFACRFKVRTEV